MLKLLVFLFLFSSFGCATATSASSNNEALLQEIQRDAAASSSDGLVIVQDGKVIARDFYGRGDRVKAVASIAKSVAAIGIEILIDQGKISSVDLPMSTWFPAWAADPIKSKITLRMILSHTAGLPSNSAPAHQPVWEKVPDAVAASAAAPIDYEPMTQFQYSSTGTVLLQRVIAKESGQSVTAFFREYVFRPLGIVEDSWSKDQRGHERLNGGLFLRTEDLVKIGELMLNRGVCHGRSIVSERGVEEMTAKSQNLFDYGLLWWLEAPGTSPSPKSSPAESLTIYFAHGLGGQYLVVYPEKRLIAVRTNEANEGNPPNSPKFEQRDYYHFLTQIAAWR